MLARTAALFIIFFIFSSFVEAQLTVLNLKENGQINNVLNTGKTKFQFIGYKKFKLYRLGIKASANLDNYMPQEETTATLKTNSTTLLMFVDNLTGQFIFKNAAGDEKVLDYNYNPTPQDFGIQNSRCAEFNLNLSTNKKLPLGTILAFSCEKVDNRIILTVSTMGTVEVNSSSLSELDGKGETWRAFDLGTLKAEATTVLELVFSKGKEEFGVKVLSKKIENKPSETEADLDKKRQIITAGFLYSMINLSIVSNYSDASTGLFVGFSSKPLFYNLKFDVEFKQGFAADNPKAISMSDLKMGIKREFEIGSKKFLIAPRLTFINSKYSQVLSGLDINLISFGAGLGFNYLFSNREKLEFNFQTILSGSEAVSATNTMQIKFNYILFGSYNLNLGAEVQNLTGKSARGNVIKVDHTSILLGLGFD